MRTRSTLEQRLLIQVLIPEFKAIKRRLTPRSPGAPAAAHQARACGTRDIFASRGLVSRRCRPVTSNVDRPLSAICSQVCRNADWQHSLLSNRRDCMSRLKTDLGSSPFTALPAASDPKRPVRRRSQARRSRETSSVLQSSWLLGTLVGAA